MSPALGVLAACLSVALLLSVARKVARVMALLQLSAVFGSLLWGCVATFNDPEGIDFPIGTYIFGLFIVGTLALLGGGTGLLARRHVPEPWWVQAGSALWVPVLLVLAPLYRGAVAPERAGEVMPGLFAAGAGLALLPAALALPLLKRKQI